jgi:cytochrome c556
MNRRFTGLRTTTRMRACAPASRGRGLSFLDTHPLNTRRSTTFPSMKLHPLTITFLGIAAFSVGCKPSEEKAAANSQEATAQQFDKVKKETKEAAQQMKDYTYAQKAEFVEKMQAQMAEIDKDLDQLAARIEKSSDAAKAEAKPKIEALREHTAKLNKQLDEARSATESTWNDVKAGFKKGYSELKEGFQQARQWASDKIAP